MRVPPCHLPPPIPFCPDCFPMGDRIPERVARTGYGGEEMGIWGLLVSGEKKCEYSETSNLSWGESGIPGGLERRWKKGWRASG